MRVMISMSILTLGTDPYQINNVINNNPILKKLQKTIMDYNENFAMTTYPRSTVLKIADDVGKLATMILGELKLKNFTFLFEDSTCFKVQNNKIYQLNNHDMLIDKESMLQGFNLTFKEYMDKGIIEEKDYSSGLFEDFICLNIYIYEKGKPCAIIEPGEIYKKSPHNCWNFVYRMRTGGFGYEEGYDDT